METFEEKLDTLNTVFTKTLEDFNVAMSSPVPRIAIKISPAEEFIKKGPNIKVAC